MKFSKPVSILGLLAVALTSVLNGTAAQAAPSTAASPESSVTSADRMTGPFAMHSIGSDQWFLPGRYAGGMATEAVGGEVLRMVVYDFTLVR